MWVWVSGGGQHIQAHGKLKSLIRRNLREIASHTSECLKMLDDSGRRALDKQRVPSLSERHASRDEDFETIIEEWRSSGACGRSVMLKYAFACLQGDKRMEGVGALGKVAKGLEQLRKEPNSGPVWLALAITKKDLTKKHKELGTCIIGFVRIVKVLTRPSRQRKRDRDRKANTESDQHKEVIFLDTCI